jgi:hypothetical protein
MCEKHKKWLKAAGVRAFKTVMQTAAATLTTATLMGEVDWKVLASTSVLAGLASLVTSLAGLPECQEVDEPTDEAA